MKQSKKIIVKEFEFGTTIDLGGYENIKPSIRFQVTAETEDIIDTIKTEGSTVEQIEVKGNDKRVVY